MEKIRYIKIVKNVRCEYDRWVVECARREDAPGYGLKR